MEAAIADLKSSSDYTISEIARKHAVGRSALSRRVNLKSTNSAHFHESKRLLNNRQEEVLLKYIRRLCERCLPPTPRIIANIAEEISGHKPSKNWSTRFITRHKHEIDARFLNTIDLARHKADSRASYEQYFKIICERMEQYQITAENIYNMDEKGFLIGRLQKTRRVVSRDLYEQGRLLGAGQDGNREWITVVATICADGSKLSPALIYKAASEDLQDEWLHEFEPEKYSCFFASSPNGWTSNELGLDWLSRLFNEETAHKAGRSWRLLFIDGHGSHLNMKFLDWCERHRILLAIYPPHSTHRLQPLDISLFAPLAAFYSQALDSHIRQSEGRTATSKRDFFSIFWLAFKKAFTEKNIASAWSKTGIWPFKPQNVLQIFDPRHRPTPEPPYGQKRSSDSPPSIFNSPSKVRKLRSVVNTASARSDRKTQKILEKLSDRMLTVSAELALSKLENQQHVEAQNRERKKKKRRLRISEQLRAEEGSGTLFLGPSEIQRYRDIESQREQADEQQKQEKAFRTQERGLKKAEKEAEAQRKRNARIAASEVRKEAAAEKKAAAQKAREAKQAQKQLAIKTKSSDRRYRCQPKKQPAIPKLRVVLEEPKGERVVEEQKTRKGRTVTQPARFRS